EGFPASPLILAAGASATPVLSFSERQGGGRWAALTYRRAAGLSPPLTIAPAEAGGTALATLSLDSRFVTPAETLIVQAPDCSVEIPRGGRFFPGPLVVRTTPTAGAPSLPAMADAVEILPDGEALNAKGTLRFDVTQAILDPRPLGIYRWDAAGALWIYEGGDLDPSGRSIALPFHRYGRFALLQDASPPVIKEVIPAPGARAVPRRAPISARVEEEGEGLDYDGVTFLLDGAPLVSEFDPDRGRSQVLEPPLLSSGPHHLRVTATDRAGNSSEPVEVEFEVGPSRNR
ncbi:MAG TPA: hypothetical protein VFT43_02915, partial [Candidatus Polarisedimenticolia bacterium]|nr:hypothetical protein [Candidatus Polarisedimenticolia bacterium]